MLRNKKASIGLHLALAMVLPAKGKAGADAAKHRHTEDGKSIPELTGRWDFSRLLEVEAEPEVVGDAEETTATLEDVARNAVRMTKETEEAKDKGEASANEGAFEAKPMSKEEIRLWAQCYNAGPYAVLKYKGDVPYEETQNYFPRIMKYYNEIEESEYDEEIEAAATKWGLDPKLIRAMMYTESSFKNDTVSHAGARGLMQVMPVVWKDISEKYDLDWDYSTAVFEPEKNLDVACAYLAWLRYDFLPRHFEAYEYRPDAPDHLVRDHNRGVPDRESPRLVAKSAISTERNIEVASVVEPEADESKVVSDAGSSSSSNNETKAEKKPARAAIEVSDASSDKPDTKAGKTSNGKTTVVARGGKGDKISISVDSKGRVTRVGDSKSKEVADASRSSKTDSDEAGQGG